MELTRNILLILHLAGMAGILISLLASRTKLSAGVTHSALLALVAGIALVGVRYGLNSQDPMKWSTPDNTKITIKLIIVITILVLGFKFKKREILPRKIWVTIAALTVSNILIAYLW
jgi:uncharacterized membrane protein YadS